MDDFLAGAHIVDSFDLNTYCMVNPASTFLLKVSGMSMKNLGIFEGDVITVDRSLSPQNGDIVVASLYGGFTVKELRIEPLGLVAYDDDSTVYPILEGSDFEIFGVVTNVIRKL